MKPAQTIRPVPDRRGPDRRGPDRRGPDLRGSDRRGGATLIVTIAILGLLTLFSLVFVRLVQFERTASSNYTDGVRARLLARAGIRRAIVELQRVAQEAHYSDPEGSGVNSKWPYRGWTRIGTSSNYRVQSLATTTYPSYAQRDAQVFGGNLVYSGYLGRTYENGADVYVLKVIDAASQLNLNHPQPDVAARMLKNLLRASGLRNDAGAASIAARVIAGRPDTLFKSRADVEALIVHESGGSYGLTPLEWAERVRDLVTVSSWVDPDVIRPWFVDEASENPKGLRELRTMPRAPINLNTARPEVLTALFAELSATNRYGTFTLSYECAAQLAQAIYTRVHPTAVGSMPPLGGTAGAMMPTSRPFRTWYAGSSILDFETWIDALPTTYFCTNPALNQVASGVPTTGPLATALGATRYQAIRDMVKAMANPNTMLNKFGIGSNHGGSAAAGPLPRLVDKSDIRKMTTEACFDAMGIYEITSLGLLLVDEGGTRLIRASQTEQVIARVYDVFRLTTQAQFEAYRGFHIPGDFVAASDRDPNNDYWWHNEPGDETEPEKVTSRGTGKAPLGVNPRFRGFEGWPGVLSYPVYSLVRKGAAENYAIEDDYVPATWDGHLTLSNLLAVQARPGDFIVGFARGRLDAFKVRAWWEPIDQNDDGDPLDKTRPTQPSGVYADANTNVDLTRLFQLASPGSPGRRPRLAGKDSNEPSPLDAVPGSAVTDGAFWNDGAALLANGVAISPDRKDESGRPYFLKYSGDNMELLRGCSVRFWVQPLADPFERNHEVLFSWIGSKDGNAADSERQVGFSIYKERSGSQVMLTLEEWADPEGIAGNPGFKWSSEDYSSTGYPGGKLRMDVTPGNTEGNPEWRQNQWHWIVVNFGPDHNGKVTVTLFVDGKRAFNVSTGSPEILWRGIETGQRFYGEMHGHRHSGRNRYPISGANINRSGNVGWVQPRLFGDYYHCDSGSRTEEVTEYTPWFADRIQAVGDRLYDKQNWPSKDELYPRDSFDWELEVRFMPKARETEDIEEAFKPDPKDLFNRGKSRTLTMDDTDSGRFDGFDFDPQGVQMGVDEKIGDHEWQMDVRCKYRRVRVVGTPCACCNDPTDSSKPAYCDHDSAITDKGGRYADWCRLDAGNTVPADRTQRDRRARCWIRVKPADIGQNTVNVGAGLINPLPVEFICDDCHGCEACDVDGPIYLGGEPAYPSSGPWRNVDAVDPSTMANAVFDNFIIVNNKERRTDWEAAPRAKNFEDRFFETALADVAYLQNEGGFGAVYRRALLELIGTQGRLGTLSWTAYPTPAAQGDLRFRLRLYQVPGIDGSGRSTWTGTNNTILTGVDAGGSDGDEVWPAGAVGGDRPGVGVEFTTGDTFYDGVGQGTAVKAELLVIEARMVQSESYTAAAGTEDPNATATRRTTAGLPVPNRLTPVLEDITLTIIRPEAQILYWEEGVEE